MSSQETIRIEGWCIERRESYLYTACMYINTHTTTTALTVRESFIHGVVSSAHTGSFWMLRINSCFTSRRNGRSIFRTGKQTIVCVKMTYTSSVIWINRWMKGYTQTVEQHKQRFQVCPSILTLRASPEWATGRLRERTGENSSTRLRQFPNIQQLLYTVCTHTNIA